MIVERILLILPALILLVTGTYSLHWLFNGREWVEAYIKKTKPQSERKPQSALKRALKRRQVVAKTLNYRDKIIELLAKDNPRKAIIFIYVLMGSFLLLSLLGLLALGHVWARLES